MSATRMNLRFKRIGPSILLPTIMVLWGVVATLQGMFQKPDDHHLLKQFCRSSHELSRTARMPFLDWFFGRPSAFRPYLVHALFKNPVRWRSGNFPLSVSVLSATKALDTVIFTPNPSDAITYRFQDRHVFLRLPFLVHSPES